jgi:hypothetical protein
LGRGTQRPLGRGGETHADKGTRATANCWRRLRNSAPGAWIVDLGKSASFSRRARLPWATCDALASQLFAKASESLNPPGVAMTSAGGNQDKIPREMRVRLCTSSSERVLAIKPLLEQWSCLDVRIKQMFVVLFQGHIHDPFVRKRCCVRAQADQVRTGDTCSSMCCMLCSPPKCVDGWVRPAAMLTKEGLRRACYGPTMPRSVSLDRSRVISIVISLARSLALSRSHALSLSHPLSLSLPLSLPVSCPVSLSPSLSQTLHMRCGSAISD